VWLALGQALNEEYVVVHDADTETYSPAFVRRLLYPVANGHAFSKGYYARVEDGALYGRLFRLFFRPLVRALADAHAAPVLEYLESFRYALAGEFAATTDLAASLRVQRGWGLEVGTLGEAFHYAGFEESAQVDLGRYEHDHRAVSGPTGLADMSRAVGAATLRRLRPTRRAVSNRGHRARSTVRRRRGVQRPLVRSSRRARPGGDVRRGDSRARPRHPAPGLGDGTALADGSRERGSDGPRLRPRRDARVDVDERSRRQTRRGPDGWW
jgi:glucosyl-3-phosphoglycerate synthase